MENERKIEDGKQVRIVSIFKYEDMVDFQMTQC